MGIKRLKKFLPAFLSMALAPILPILAVSPAYAVGSPFVCDSHFYQVSNGQFYVLNFPGFTYSKVGSAATVTNLNSAGWNPADNYIYAMASNTSLRQIASDGSITTPGTITGLTAENGGDFISNDKMIVVSTGSAAIQLLTLNRTGGVVTSGTGTNITVTGSGSYTGSLDIAIFPSTGGTYVGYSLNGTVLTTFTFPNGSPTTASYTTKTVTGLQNGATGAFGAQWVDSQGNFYAYDNTTTPAAATNALYEINRTDLNSVATTIAANDVQEETAPGAAPNDGVSCRTAPSVFAPQMTTTASITNVSGTSALATGYLVTNVYPVNPLGNENNAKICYSLSPTVDTTPGNTYGLLVGASCFTTSQTFPANGTTQNFSVVLTGLSPNTTYYYQSAAINTPPGSIAPFAGFSPVASFTTPAIPTFTSISPASGSVGGGDSATITGTNFTGATSVTIDGIPVTSFTVNSPTSITITTPAGTTLGAKNVVITTPGGTATGPGAFTYVGQVTFNANGGTGSMPAQSGSSPAALNANAFSFTGSTFLGWNTAANGSGTAYSNGATYPFTSSTTLYAQWLTVASVAPPVGPLSSTTPITITGTGFTGATGVTVNGVAATSVVVVNATTITAVVPTSATVGPKNVVVTTPAGTGTGTGLFTYQATVTFNGNGSTGGSTAAQSASVATNLTANGFTRTGYTFAGWNTIAGGGGTAYANSASYTFASDLTLYAQWTGISNNVTYNANLAGTTGSVPGTVAYATGATVTVVGNTGTLAKSGFTFAGWNTAADGSGTTYQAGNTFTMPGAAVTLYARWTALPTVTSVSANTGDIAGGNTVTITGTNFTGVTAVTINGVAVTSFTFLTSTTISVVVPAGTSTGAKSILVTTPGGTNTANTLYTYTVTVSFNANGGTGTMANQTNSVATALTADGFTPATGYTANVPFWSTLPGGGGTTYANLASFPFNTTTADLTLYAQWTGTSLNVIYNGNGNTGGSAPGTVGHTAGSTVTVLGNTGSLVLTNQTFFGWNTAANGSGTSYAPGATFTMPGTAVTLYAQWTTVTSISPTSGTLVGGTPITITGTNFTGATGATINGVAVTSFVVVNPTTITAIAPAGVTGAAKNVVVTTPTGSATGSGLYTYFATVTFNNNSGSGSMANQTASVATALTTNTFTRSLYYFANWNTAADGSGTSYANGASYPFASDVTLYAIWNGPPTITLVSPSVGPLAGGTTVNVTGTNFTGATSVTINGVNVTSFTVNSSTSITLTTPAGSSIGAKDLVITAPYGIATGAGVYSYQTSVTFNANGGTGTMANQTASAPTALTANAFTYANSTFLGWNTLANGTGTAYANSASFPFTANTTLYAQWIHVTSVSPTSGPLAGGTAITITGTGFTGATGVTINGVAATSVVVVNSTTITAVTPVGASVGAKDIIVTVPGGSATGAALYTYYATVTFNGNGSTSGSMSNQSASVPTALTSNAFAKTNSSFTGWNTAANGSGTAYANSASYPFAVDVTLYAQWMTVTSISPNSGTTLGGTSITITGTNFTGATGATINGIPITSFVVVNSTTITGVTPASASAGAKDVVVTAPSGTATGTGIYTYNLAAQTIVITSTPTTPTYGGTYSLT